MNEMTKPPLRSEPHPITGALYTAIGDGLVRVEDKSKGKYGVFKMGRHLDRGRADLCRSALAELRRRARSAGGLRYSLSA